MMHIYVVVWHGEIESVKYAIRALRILAKVTVYSHFDEILDPPIFAQRVINSQCDAVLVWCYDRLKPAHIAMIRSLCNVNQTSSPIFALYNWDDPYALTHEANRALFVEMDIVFTCSQDAQEWYSSQGIPSHYLLPGFYQQTEIPSVITCDISFIVGNLYDDIDKYPNQKYLRKSILEALECANDLQVELYGQSNLALLYPRIYKGLATYEDQYSIARRSRLCISTHVMESTGYLNERSIVILGSGGGALVLDSAKNAASIPRTSFLQLGSNPLADLRRYLSFADLCTTTASIGKLYAAKSLTWTHWATSVVDQLKMYKQQSFR
jgi:hypothetical protein